MRKGVVASLVVLACVSWASATTIIDDDFNGTSLDSSVWTTQTDGSATVTVADSKVSVQAGWGTSAIRSLATLAPGAGETVTMTATNVTLGDPWSFHVVLGFESGPSIQWQKFSDSDRGMFVSIGSNKYKLAELGNASWSDITLNWTPTQVTASVNGTQVFDSAVNVPVGGGSWTIPTTASNVCALDYNNRETISVDRMVVTSVPEPMTVALLSLGGLMLRRKH